MLPAVRVGALLLWLWFAGLLVVWGLDPSTHARPVSYHPSLSQPEARVVTVPHFEAGKSSTKISIATLSDRQIRNYPRLL